MAFNYKVGLHNVGSYQVAGKPFASGNIRCANSVTKIEFPSVTNWVTIENNSLGKQLRVGFSEGGIVSGALPFAGLGQNRFFTIPPTDSGSYSSKKFDLKLSQIFLEGGTQGNVHVVAGLTSINTGSIDNVQVSPGNGTTGFTNWSGSAGV